MIVKLENSQLEIAQKMHTVFQESYSVEAKILKAVDFPPVKRPLEDYIKTNNEFYGYFMSGELAGVIEIVQNKSFVHIQSLVAHPLYFRRGIATRLMEYTLKTFNTSLFVVETGVDNEPACKLYRKLGFVEVKQWNTNFGIRKVKFEREN